MNPAEFRGDTEKRRVSACSRPAAAGAGVRSALFVGALTGALALGGCSDAQSSESSVRAASQAIQIQKKDTRKIYVHMMPWFDVPGYHWDMVGRNYNPQIGPYNSGDYYVIEYQMLLMKYSGIDGVIIDWPGLSTMNADLPSNAQNTDKIINQTAKFGMEFTVCFEDQYATSTGDAVNSMNYVRDHYFNQPNHIVINGGPALFVFGPEKIGAGDWPTVLAGTGTDPMFFTLWYNNGAGGARDGTFAWLYSDALTGVANYYQRNDQGLKIPVLYPGFNAAYPNGAPGWSIPYDSNGDTFSALWGLALNAGNVLQIATWNDYTEGTMIEPTNEFGYRFLTTLQKLVGTSYTQDELALVKLLFDRRNANDPNAEAASQALINLDPATACKLLNCGTPNLPGPPNGGSGSGGSGSGGSGSVAGSPAMGGGNGGQGHGATGGGNPSGGSPAGGSLNAGGMPSASGGSPSGSGAFASVGGVANGSGDSTPPASSSSGCSIAHNGGSNAKLWPLVGALILLARRRRLAS